MKRRAPVKHAPIASIEALLKPLNKKAYYLSTVTGIIDECKAILTKLEETQGDIATTLKEAEKNQDQEELKSTYAATGKKYLPVFESLFEDVARLRPKIDSLAPYRKYRRSQQYLVESFDCLDKSVQMQKDAFKKMAEGDIETAVKDLLEASPLTVQGSKAIERFSSSL